MNDTEHVHVVANLYGMQHAGQPRVEHFAHRIKDLMDSPYGSRIATVDDIIATSIVPGEMAKRLDDTVKEGDSVALLVGDGSLKNVVQDILQYSTSPDVKGARY